MAQGSGTFIGRASTGVAVSSIVIACFALPLLLWAADGRTARAGFPSPGYGSTGPVLVLAVGVMLLGAAIPLFRIRLPRPLRMTVAILMTCVLAPGVGVMALHGVMGGIGEVLVGWLMCLGMLVFFWGFSVHLAQPAPCMDY